MNKTVVRWADCAPTPWKNGGGITREVAASPATSPFDWRISIADINTDGPFSAFPGVRRTITCFEGNGMTLQFAGSDHRIRLAVPFTFSGDAVTECGLTDGPTRNLNVMTRPGRAIASVVVTETENVPIDENQTVLVVAISGELTVEGVEPLPLKLNRRDSLLLTTPGSIAVTGGELAIVRIDPDNY